MRALGAAIVTFLALAIFAGACVGCTDVGCTSVAQFDLDVALGAGDEVYARACVDDFCRELEGALPADECLSNDEADTLLVCGAEVPSPGEVQLILPEEQNYEGAHQVSLELRRDGVVIADVAEPDTEFKRTQPNQNCPPVCWEARLQQT